MWYGICKVQSGHSLYCSNNGTAQPLKEEGQNLLKEYCPHLVNGTNDTFTCCDVEQVTYFAITIFISISTAFRIITKLHNCYKRWDSQIKNVRHHFCMDFFSHSFVVGTCLFFISNRHLFNWLFDINET